MTSVEAQPKLSSYVDGPLAPVTEEITAFDLPVTGTIPEEFTGRYVRNGPNPIGADPENYHWFTGHGMLHGVRLDGGRAEWYRNRYVRGYDVAELLGEPARPESRRAEGVGGSPNTNVIQVAGRTFAIVEAGTHPVEVSDELETIATVDFGGTLEGAFTAHPRRDPSTGKLHAITYYWPEESVRYVVVGPDARVEHETVIPMGERLMVHDTAITETKALILDLPVTFDLEGAMTGSPFPYRWTNEREARVGVMPLGGTADDVRWVSVPAAYVFHSFNAFDLPDGKVVLDVVRWPKVFDVDRLGPGEGTSRVERWTLDPATGTSTIDVVSDRQMEFSRVNESLQGRKHTIGYGAGLETVGAVHGTLRRVDFTTGEVRSLDLGPTTAAQEFVFVPREGSAGETDGWLMGLASDRANGQTDLVIIDAGDFDAGPVARVHLPARVPDGFHGNWLPDAG